MKSSEHSFKKYDIKMPFIEDFFPLMHQMLGFLVLLFLTLVYSHNVLCNYLVLDWTWRCNSRLKAVYLRLEVIEYKMLLLCQAL